MLVRIIKSYRNIVTICDEGLLGKKFKEGRFQLEVKENFFEGEKKTEEETIEIIKKMIKEDCTFNIVGQESVETALKTGIINHAGIKRIQGIPFSLILA